MLILPQKNWYTLTPTEVAQALEVNLSEGVTLPEAAARLDAFGPNTLATKKATSAWRRFLQQLNNPLIYILLAAALVTALLGEWVDCSVIFGVVLVNAMIGFLQEAKAENSLEALRQSVVTEATVLRSHRRYRMSSEEIVPGDVVFLQSGDKVPSDLRLFQVKDLQIDESMLTGESVPVRKQTGEFPGDTPLGDRANMAYAGTLVTYGQGQGVTVATAGTTETGKISHMLEDVVVLETPLTRKIAAFSNYLLWVILGLAALTFGVGVLRSEPWFEMFMAAVALAVGAIPEGLPAAVTITLAIGVNRMARRRAIIRKLPAVETLGSTTIICSDKTGTLTENQMTVQAIDAGGQAYDVTGGGYSPDGEVRRAGIRVMAKEDRALQACLLAGVLCNEAHLARVEDRWRIEGDPTEGALLVSARKAGLLEHDLTAAFPRQDSIPFESERQYMATLHQPAHEDPVVFLKGSLEQIVEKCSHAIQPDGSIAALNAAAVVHRAESLASQGLRVLAMARKTLPAGQATVSHEDVASGLVLLGLQAMIDPPRQEAIRAVQVCQSAGIRVKMITGDHALTAAAIAERLGLRNNPGRNEQKPFAVTGRELEKMSDQAFYEAAMHTDVFARVAPEQKLRLVQALQAQGHVVAMTGDGVNDAPALRQADIGVAMGITGTEVSKEAAAMVLTDDNFASIEAAVEEGRTVFDNLTKFIVWTLPTNLGEGLVILAAIFLGVQLPILPVQILWINMTTAVLLGLMLAFEIREPGIMQRAPRNPQTPILTRALLWRIFLVAVLLLGGAFGLFRAALDMGMSLAEARTVAVNTFVMVELVYLFNCRSLKHSMWSLGVFSNPWVIGGVALMLVLQGLYTYAPFMNFFFGSAPIGWRAWAEISMVAVAAYAIVGLEKWLVNRWQRKPG